MSTKGRENWEKFKAGYVIDSSYAEEPSTGNAGRDRWNALKKTIDIRSTAPRQTAQDDSSGAKKGFFERLGLTVSGGAKGSLAGNMDAMGAAYEAGQSGRTKRDTAELKDAQWAVARAKHDYDADPSEVNKSALGIATTKMKAFADVLGEGAYEQALEAAYGAAAQFDTGDLKALYNSLGVVTPKTGTGVQQQTAKAARDLAVRVQDSAAEDIREAKDGTSKFWQMAIDAGASATQMALDAASNAVLGTKGSMVPFATRAFGGATMEARQGGADLGKQALYGAAQTAKEVFTEKMFNIALPYAKTYGKGGFDGIVENGIRKAADKLGKSKIGKAALEKVLTFGASAATEGMEELIGDWMEWQLPRIYGGDVATAEETLSDSLYDFVVGSMSGMIGGAMTEPMKAINSAVQAQEVKKAYGAQQWDLVNESEELSPGNELAKKYRERLDGGKNLSGRQLIRLMQQNETDMLNGDKAKIQAATEKRLTELGESDNVRQLAEIVARQMAGEELSRDEQMQIDGSKYGKRVLDELNPEDVKVDENGNPRDTYSSSWTGSIGTSVIDPVTFNRNIGVTGAKYNPETQKLDAIVKDSEGNIQTVPLEEAKASPMQEELFDWAEELKEAGPVMVGAYQATQNLELYAKSFRLAYEYGKAHVPMDYVENSEAVNYLHPVQLKLAYEEGEKAQQRQTQAAEKKINSGGTRTAAGKKKPAVSFGGATVGGTTYAPVDRKTLNRRQWAAVEAMRTFSKATGVDVVFYQSQANEKGRYEGANGFYRDGTIYLDINAGRNSTQDVQETAVLKTAAHELTHFIQQNSPTQYEELKQFVVEKLTREEGISFDDLVTDKQRREHGLSYEEAVDEVVADACEMMLKDSKAVEQLARENRSLAERIRQWIRKWVRSLKAAMEGLTADRPESRAMMQYAQELQEIWDKALVDAARNGRGTMRGNAPAENRQSIRETSDGKKYVKADRQVLFGSDPDSWSEQLEDYINGKIRRGQDVQLIAEDGDVILLTSTSAGKLSDNHTSDGRTMSDAAFERKANAAAHIDELVEVSSKGKKTVIDKDARHGDMASGGWNYRTAYFMDFDGKYYKTTISVAEGAGGSVIYNVGHMKEEAFPKIKGSYAEKGNGPRGNASDSSIRQSNDNSQEKSSEKAQFSMREPVEETRDLIALHNMSLDNLRGALKLGGLPMPSIAIVKASAGHSKYGPISVVFEKNTIDPQADRRNKVYGGDAYTPTAPQVEYPVQYKAMRRVEKHIAELSEQVAGGIFRNDTALRRLGIDSKSSMDTEAMADRLSRDDSVQAAYLADTGKTLEPVRKLKEFSRYGNGALQQLVSEIGVQELARINAEMETGNYDAAADAEKAVRDIIRSAYEVKHRSFLDRKPELKQQRIDKYMENNVSRMTVEDFVRDAWEFYQDNGATTDEVDRWATADKLHEEVNPAAVKEWLLGQLDGVLGEAGIYNGKERYTPSGNERSFAQTHYAYTLENIVRAMSQTQKERGGQTFGVTAKSMQAVSTPSYGSIAEIKADSGRLGAVEGDAYDAAVEKVEKQIEQATRRVMRENKPHSDNQFEETEIIGEVMMEAAKGAKTESAIRKVFQREGYSVSKETIGVMQSVFRSAAQLPTEYFEAKPQRAIRFAEAAAVVIPDNIPAEIKQDLKKQGATIREYKAGDEQSRLEAVNVDERVRFSVREVGGETMPVLDVQNDTRDYKVAEAYLKTLVDTEHPFATILVDAQSVYIGKDLPGEYKSSEYTKSLRKEIRAAKMQAATNLDEMLLLAENGEWRENVKDKHKIDAKYGWYRYSTRFALPVLDIKKAVDHYTVYSGTLLIRNDADGKSYLYDLLDIKKEKVISSTSFSAQRRSEVFEPKPSPKQYMQNSRESQAEISDTEQRQMREYRMSDRDVLRMAAGMAKNDRSNRWAVEDKNRLELLERRMLLLDEINAELAALQEERATILSGRKKSELKGEDRNELIKTENRIQIAKDQIEREEARAFNLVSMDVYKPLLKKARSVVEQDAATRARTEYREKREAAEQMAVTRRKVERTAKRLTEYMTTNTDKKHIPEALKKPIGELLESLDFSAKKSGRTTRADLKYIEAMQDLQAALAAQRLFDDTGEGTDLFKGYMDLPAGFESLLAVHVEKVKNALEKHPLKTGLVRAMDIDDLKELDVILSVMSRSVTKMNEMFVNRRFGLVSDAAENSINTMSTMGQHQDKAGESFALWDNTLPWYAFQRFGEGGKAVFEGLQDGWDKLAFNMKTVLDFRKDLIEDALARKWDTEKHRVELTDPDGATVTAVLTTAQLMSLHCLSKRKQALGHLLGGGIRPSAIELTDSIGDRIKKRSLNQDKQFKLTEESLAHLLGLLTPEQVKIADAMQKFMTEQGSLWGNEVTMIRFGYRGFTEQNYFPIETDAQDRQAKTGDTKDGSLYRLQNISAVKPLVKNANNALVLRGIFDVFANHTADMAKYNALVLPILDAQKWYNYKYASKNEAGQVSTRTVQRAMTKAYGASANNYVIKFLQDLNGVKESGDRGDTLAKKMISNYKRAMVAANMRVALLQPTAYARASAVLDYEYLAKAFADKTSTKQATEEMLQHSGIALWKSLGFFDTDVGRSIRDQIKGKSSKLENFVDKTMVPAEKGDEITWARLWRACKLEVQDKQKLTGDELLKATAERFREVVYRTQVVDSTMTRSHTMRSNGTLSKMATSFMSEPTMSYNMVMESARQTVGDAKRMGMRVAIRRNWKALGRSLQTYVMSAAVTAIVESLYDALRDPDDDEYMEKVWKAFGGEKPETAKDQVLSIIFGLNGNFAGNINPIGKVPYLRDVVSIFGGYSNGRMDTEAVANLKKAIDIWDEVIRLQTGDLDKATKTTYYGNMTTYGMIYPTAKALSQLTGLPGSAAMREVTTAWNTTVGTVWPALKMRTYEDKKLREAWENYGKDSGVSYAVMYRAIQDLKEFESDRDADGNAISGSLKAKYVEYIRGMGLTRAQEKAVWEAAKNSSWSDKGTPWG